MLRKLARLLLAGLLSGLFGCGDSPYERRDGAWHYDKVRLDIANPGGFNPLKGPFARGAEGGYYRGALINGSDGTSFEALDDHYARDKARAYHCDTYRKGQEYYSIKHNRITVLEGVDAASFRLLKSGYARDSSRLYYEGARTAVKDLDSFEVLEYGYTRDKVTGYFHRVPVQGSDGATFSVVDSYYARDKTHVYFSSVRPGASNEPSVIKSVSVAGALPDSFVSLETGYARDAAQAYYDGRALTKDVANFKVLQYGYAKSGDAAFYRGQRVEGADAATFDVLADPSGPANARDARTAFRDGKAVSP